MVVELNMSRGPTDTACRFPNGTWHCFFGAQARLVYCQRTFSRPTILRICAASQFLQTASVSGQPSAAAVDGNFRLDRSAEAFASSVRRSFQPQRRSRRSVAVFRFQRSAKEAFGSLLLHNAQSSPRNAIFSRRLPSRRLPHRLLAAFSVHYAYLALAGASNTPAQCGQRVAPSLTSSKQYGHTGAALGASSFRP